MTRTSLVAACAAVALTSLSPANAQPGADPATTERNKSEARALVKEGARLYAAKNYAGARDLFVSAYAKFPSAKILINLGTTNKEMSDLASAANYYQLYLGDPDADAARVTEIRALVQELDAKVGKLSLVITPADAEFQIDDGPWLPGGRLSVVRVPLTPWILHARRDGFVGTDVDGPGSSGTITVTLEAIKANVVDTTQTAIATPIEAPTPIATVHRRKTLTLGAAIDAAIDGKGRGVAWSPGISVRWRDRLEIDLRGQFSATPGVYVGARGFATTGTIRPSLSVGAPMFWKSGFQPGIGAGAGLSWHPSDRVYLLAEVGFSYFFSSLMTDTQRFDRLVLVPLVGAHASL
jgi:hypothetical protein